MNEIKILPLIINLIGAFYRSSHDALIRAQDAHAINTTKEPTGLNIFTHCQKETQASIESIVFSFLVIEAVINYIFVIVSETNSAQTNGLDKWLQQKWKRKLSIYDRFVILLTRFANANLDEYQYLNSLFIEFITFRNRIVHAIPEQYNALFEQNCDDNELFLYDVEPKQDRQVFQCSHLSGEIGRINFEDAERSFEIMLLIVCFLDEQTVSEIEFPYKSGEKEYKWKKVRDIIAIMENRYYSKINIESFTPEFLKNIKPD